ncbi:DUF2087 domain-containing protein [Streptomyces sp. SCUT-3]|uniref:DUF2087 domain-containing protein n=1 Tax=Streptomyces TaxID=1883 RepID=UPI000CAF44BC|nr:DUF2087 domain-containing protein [Streptomyces sp. SCUT-3]PLW66660.1 hypothetical protein C0036_21870 [Streptomyces sp. DJ]QMV24728.1 DUF2087 domain-containing protein [Streptomyces sp. SCUT-3]
MSDDDSRGSHGVTALFSRGRPTTIPRRAARREQLLVHLAETLFERDRAYSEREVDEALLTVHDDFPALRRHLVEAGLLIRTRDGSTYRRAERPDGRTTG